MRRLRRIVGGGIAATAALVVLVAPGHSAGTAAAKRQYSASVSWIAGSGPGNTEQGTGTFSGTLGARTSAIAHVMAAATGVPLPAIAKGGKYAIRITFLSQGQKGTLVAKFKDKSLGMSCASFKPRTFVPKETGTITTIGGTGPAARWRVALTFSKDGSTFGRTEIEKLDISGIVGAHLGSARKMTAACKATAKLL